MGGDGLRCYAALVRFERRARRARRVCSSRCWRLYRWALSLWPPTWCSCSARRRLPTTRSRARTSPQMAQIWSTNHFFLHFAPRVHLVKSARGHDAPGLEGSIVDGASEIFSPGWPFLAHAPHLGVQNSNDIVSIWNSDPSDFRMVKCGRGHDPGVNDSIRATGGQLLQFCDSTFEYNYAIPELSPCSNFTTRIWRAEPVQCDRGFDGHQEQPTECLPPVPTAILYHTADFRPNSSSELLHCSNTEILPIPIILSHFLLFQWRVT